MINKSLAGAFERIADLMEILGESGFRVNSYRRAARTLESHPTDVAELAKDGKLTSLPGIGKGTADKIDEFLASGRVHLLDELEAKLPPNLPDLLKIQGLGPKKISAIHSGLGVAGMEDLKRVIESGELAKLSGFGAQSVKRIAEGLSFLEVSSERRPLGMALAIAERMAESLRAYRGVQRVELAGSLRRGCETIGDVDILCEAADGPAVVQAFTSQSDALRVLASGDTKGSVTVGIERGQELQIDLRVVAEESFGAAWQYFTGSKQHNVRLRELAVKKKWRLNEYGLFDGERQIAGRTEESIYDKLGVPFVPPEIREDAGEFDVEQPPALITLDQIRGDVHMHTTASDGKSTIEEMACAGIAAGYDYIAITDHSKSSVIANGLTVDRMKRHIENVRATNTKIKGITILTGCECDILPDGSLDYADEILAECDIVVASVHSAMTGGKVSPTERTIAAMQNRYVTIIGHPTGRLIGRRPPMELDMGELIRVAFATGTAMEINSSWQRLDLKAEHVRLAVDAGVKLSINTDSHHKDGLPNIRLGVVTARRGWACADNVLNALTTKGLMSWVKKKRAKGA